jgi:hypothetical protein
LVSGEPLAFKVFGDSSMFPASRHPRKRLSRKLDFRWFLVDQWIFEVFRRRIRVSRIEIPQNNVLPENSIFKKPVFSERDFHWFPVDQWDFEGNGLQVRVPHMELPLVPSLRPTFSILPCDVLLTQLQTHTQSFIS